MWKVFLGLLLIVAMAGCGYLDTRTTNVLSGLGSERPDGKPSSGNKTYADEIAISWEGHRVDELIKHWGEPSWIGMEISELSEPEILAANKERHPEADFKSFRTYAYVTKGRWVSEEKCGFADVAHALASRGNPLANLSSSCPTYDRQLSCVILFKVNEKGIIFNALAVDGDGCRELISDTPWRSAPEKSPAKKTKAKK